jgi:hypothetical protein
MIWPFATVSTPVLAICALPRQLPAEAVRKLAGFYKQYLGQTLLLYFPNRQKRPEKSADTTKEDPSGPITRPVPEIYYFLYDVFK